VSLEITIMIHSAGTAAAEGGIAVRVFSLMIHSAGTAAAEGGIAVRVFSLLNGSQGLSRLLTLTAAHSITPNRSLASTCKRSYGACPALT
jgi:hypothetical protein